MSPTNDDRPPRDGDARHQAAMDLWQADVAARTQDIDPEALAARVLADLRAGRQRPQPIGVSTVWAVAAAVVLALGALGTVLVSQARPETAVHGDFAAIDASMMEAIADHPALWLGESGGMGLDGRTSDGGR